jgi:RNA 2',3'-cyclic 3'-phosphodiesterase
LSSSRTLFLAISLTRELCQQLDPVLGRLAVIDPMIRPVRSDGLHLTVCFLGRVEATDEPAIGSGALRVCQRTPPFSVTLQGLGLFAQARQSRVIWAGVSQGSDQLGALADGLEEELGKVGWPSDRRPFRAHCTLARVSQAMGSASRASLTQLVDESRGEPPLSMTAGSLDLLESVAVPGGPNRYLPLASWRLEGR